MESSSAASRPLVPVMFRVIVIIGFAIAATLIILSFIASSNLDDPLHPQLHAGSAAVALALTWLTAGSGQDTLVRRALGLAFVLLAVSFLVEGVGGFGYGHEGRNDLARAHDLGIVLTTFAMLADTILFGVAVGGLVASRRSSRVLPILVGAGIGAVGLFGVKVLMVGM